MPSSWNYAVELDLLAANPIDKVSWKAPKVADQIDRRVVASPRLVTALLEAVAGIRPELVAFFGCLYDATMRPGEAVALERSHCEDLPRPAGVCWCSATPTRASDRPGPTAAAPTTGVS
jgi:hypothetical protein